MDALSLIMATHQAGTSSRRDPSATASLLYHAAQQPPATLHSATSANEPRKCITGSHMGVQSKNTHLTATLASFAQHVANVAAFPSPTAALQSHFTYSTPVSATGSITSITLSHTAVHCEDSQVTATMASIAMRQTQATAQLQQIISKSYAEVNQHNGTIITDDARSQPSLATASSIMRAPQTQQAHSRLTHMAVELAELDPLINSTWG